MLDFRGLYILSWLNFKVEPIPLKVTLIACYHCKPAGSTGRQQQEAVHQPGQMANASFMRI